MEMKWSFIRSNLCRGLIPIMVLYMWSRSKICYFQVFPKKVRIQIKQHMITYTWGKQNMVIIKQSDNNYNLGSNKSQIKRNIVYSNNVHLAAILTFLISSFDLSNDAILRSYNENVKYLAAMLTSLISPWYVW